MAMDEHIIKINLLVGNKRYVLKTNIKEEAALRLAAKEVNLKLHQYKRHFTGNDTHKLDNFDYMAMTAIQAASEVSQAKLRADEFEEKLKALSSELDTYLKANVR